MTYSGTVKNGVVVLDGRERLPDGTIVKVQPVSKADVASLWQGLLALQGKARNLPSDLARNHDHYLHGTKRR